MKVFFQNFSAVSGKDSAHKMACPFFQYDYLRIIQNIEGKETKWDDPQGDGGISLNALYKK